MSSIERYYRMIDRAEVLSLDVFDTALLRRVGRPIDVFILVEEQYRRAHRPKPWDFVQARVKAELDARNTRWLDQRCGEVGFDEIYAQLDAPAGWDRHELERLELAAERAVSVPNEFIQRLYRYARAQHKRVVFASDMYLPQPFLAELLARAGYEGPLWTSATTPGRRSKASGTLFPYLAEQLQVAPNAILHIGDNAISDVMIALRHGFCALLYERCGLRAARARAESLLGGPAGAIQRGLAQLVHQHPEVAEPFWYRFGHHALGPVLASGESPADVAAELGQHPVARAALALLDDDHLPHDASAIAARQGARAFAAAWAELHGALALAAPPRTLATAVLRRVLHDPTPEEARHLGELPRLGQQAPLLPPQRATRMLGHYRASLWRSGYRARLRGMFRSSSNA